MSLHAAAHKIFKKMRNPTPLNQQLEKYKRTLEMSMQKIAVLLTLTLSACAPQQVEFVATDLPKPKPPLACVQAPKKLSPYPKDEKSLSDLAKHHMALRSQYRGLLVKYRACQGFVKDVAT